MPLTYSTITIHFEFSKLRQRPYRSIHFLWGIPNGQKAPDLHNKNPPRVLYPQATSGQIQTLSMEHPERPACPLLTPQQKIILSFVFSNTVWTDQDPFYGAARAATMPICIPQQKFASRFVSSDNARTDPDTPYGASRATRIPVTYTPTGIRLVFLSSSNVLTDPDVLWGTPSGHNPPHSHHNKKSSRVLYPQAMS